MIDRRVGKVGDTLIERFHLEEPNKFCVASQSTIINTGIICTDGESPLKFAVILQRYLSFDAIYLHGALRNLAPRELS